MFSPVIKRVGLAVLVLAALPALGACTGKEVRSSLGMKRNNPDEFQVVSQPPLSVPPMYHLRPPSEDAPRATVPADKRAQSLLVEGKELPLYESINDPDSLPDTAVTDVQTDTLGTSGEAVLLQNAGANTANDKIRAVLHEENAPAIREEKKEKGFFGKIHDKLNPGDKEPVVDAAKEQERIRENKAEGKPVTEGETPVIDHKNEGVLDRLL